MVTGSLALFLVCNRAHSCGGRKSAIRSLVLRISAGVIGEHSKLRVFFLQRRSTFA
jgi:hypothetical protein